MVREWSDRKSRDAVFKALHIKMIATRAETHGLQGGGTTAYQLEDRRPERPHPGDAGERHGERCCAEETPQ